MSLVTVQDVKILNPVGKLTDSFNFEIHFDCREDIPKDLEWRVVYLGSAEDHTKDQVLDCVLVGPLKAGECKFSFESEGVDAKKIPNNEIIGVTAVILMGVYEEQEFVRIGYYVNVSIEGVEEEEEIKETACILEKFGDKLVRTVKTDAPVVTRFSIHWIPEKQDKDASSADESSSTSSIEILNDYAEL